MPNSHLAGSERARLCDVLAEAGRSPKVQEEYLMSAAEFVVNICLGRNWISSHEAIGTYVPREIPWSQKTGWK